MDQNLYVKSVYKTHFIYGSKSVCIYCT